MGTLAYVQNVSGVGIRESSSKFNARFNLRDNKPPMKYYRGSSSGQGKLFAAITNLLESSLMPPSGLNASKTGQIAYSAFVSLILLATASYFILGDPSSITAASIVAISAIFTAVSSYLSWIFCQGVVATTRGKTITWNFAAMNKLSPFAQRFVLAEELWHTWTAGALPEPIDEFFAKSFGIFYAIAISPSFMRKKQLSLVTQTLILKSSVENIKTDADRDEARRLLATSLLRVIPTAKLGLNGQRFNPNELADVRLEDLMWLAHLADSNEQPIIMALDSDKSIMDPKEINTGKISVIVGNPTNPVFIAELAAYQRNLLRGNSAHAPLIFAKGADAEFKETYPNLTFIDNLAPGAIQKAVPNSARLNVVVQIMDKAPAFLDEGLMKQLRELEEAAQTSSDKFQVDMFVMVALQSIMVAMPVTSGDLSHMVELEKNVEHLVGEQA